MMIWTRSDWMTKPRIKLPTSVLEDIVTNDDGFKYYWPFQNSGMLSAYHLRQIADYLDEENKEWDATVNQYFEDQEYAARGYSSY